MKVSIVVPGHLKNFVKDGVKEYVKRIGRFCEINLHQVKKGGDVNTIDSSKILNQESKNILSHVRDSDYVILLDRKGQEFGSREFASFLEEQFLTRSHLVFVIGGALGTSDAVKKRANIVISLSKMTFTHQMSVLILLEQLFRAFKIIKNQKYHY